MAPLKLGYSDGTGSVLQKHLDFYSRRSHHIGAITPELQNQIPAWLIGDAKQVAKAQDAIHSAYQLAIPL